MTGEATVRQSRTGPSVGRFEEALMLGGVGVQR